MVFFTDTNPDANSYTNPHTNADTYTNADTLFFRESVRKHELWRNGSEQR